MKAGRAPAPTGSMTNGSGAAAILSAGVGCFAVALLAAVGDKSAAAKRLLNLYKPTGALSGVTTGAILLWLCLWGVLEWRWQTKTVPIGRVSVAALVLLGLGLLLTFPPIVDLF
jgi:hypothetical protein